MSNRQSWVLGAAIIVGSLLLGVFLGRPCLAEEKKTSPEPATGRYQVIKGDGSHIVLTDTQTGRCWSNGDYRDTNNWHDLGSPVKEKKE